jgi:RNA polymerase sigma factor (sigma-70 family)
MHRGAYVRRETVLSWLITTAVREAVKLLRRSDREISLDTLVEAEFEFPAPTTDRTPQTLSEHRERLRSLNGLPYRQQCLLWLYGLGLSYEEIARSQGCTSRTVERQLQRARALLQEA